MHYTRELRISADVVLNLIPRSTGVEVIQERGHLFILTDLLLICERMTREEAARGGPDGPDMWLLYPPLAGKHLRVAPVDGSGLAWRFPVSYVKLAHPIFVRYRVYYHNSQEGDTIRQRSVTSTS